MADGPADVCVCVLFNGGDAGLARAHKVLNGPMQELARFGAAFRFGYNAPDPGTRAFLDAQTTAVFSSAVVTDTPAGMPKYAMMRQMFAAALFEQKYVMWFDDNSCIDPAVNVDNWLPRLILQLAASDVVGSVYKSAVTDTHREWLKTRTCCQSTDSLRYVPYVLGNWWAAKVETLLTHDWPAEAVSAKSGDVLFGVLAYCHKLRVNHFRDGLQIGANNYGVETVLADPSSTPQVPLKCRIC